MTMKYYNDRSGKYEDLILNDDDLSVKATVERIYAEKPTEDVNRLSSKVQDYYYDVVGISNNRLWTIIDIYCEELISEKIRNRPFKVADEYPDNGFKVRH